MTLYEVDQAADIIKETAHPDVNLIFGADIDLAPRSDEIRITVIATGFENSGVRVSMETPKVDATRNIQRPRGQEPADQPRTPTAGTSIYDPITVDTGNLDIPTFLRNRTQK